MDEGLHHDTPRLLEQEQELASAKDQASRAAAELKAAMGPEAPCQQPDEPCEEQNAADEDVELVAELDGMVEPGAPVTVLPDATMLLEDDAERKDGCGVGPTPASQDQPVLSLVSLNPRTAATVDILRGQLTVLSDLPEQCGGVRTVRISCGRDAANTIVLKDGRISLRHFTVRVRAAAGSRVVLDLLDQSSNGTWVDGRKVGRGRRVPLKVGDRIVALPASLVGREGEVGYVLLSDTKGAWCSAGAASSCSSETSAGSEHDAGKEPQAGDEKPCAEPPKGLPRALEQDLRCGVCTDLLHRCLTVVPCGHNFCAACLVRWRRCSAHCPGCRELVRQAVRNLDVDCVVETFVKEHPEAARSAAELREQDAIMGDAESAGVLRWLLRDKDPGYQYSLSATSHSNPVYAAATPQRYRPRHARHHPRQAQSEPELRRPSSAHSAACTIS